MLLTGALAAMAVCFAAMGVLLWRAAVETFA
jgi:hypothetical protein